MGALDGWGSALVARDRNINLFELAEGISAKRAIERQKLWRAGCYLFVPKDQSQK